MKVRAPDLVQPRRRWSIHDAYLLAFPGASSASIAADLGVTERYVVMMQRRLGLRKIKPNRRQLRAKE